MIADEKVAVAAASQIGIEADVAKLFKVARRIAVEPQHPGDHRPEPAFENVFRLREQGGQILAGIFIIAMIDRHRKRHFGGRGFHADMVEQSGEIGIGRLVVDDEADIDRDGAAVVDDFFRVGVAAESVVGFVKNDIVIPRQRPGAGQAGYAGADHRDPLSNWPDGVHFIHLGLAEIWSNFFSYVAVWRPDHRGSNSSSRA